MEDDNSKQNRRIVTDAGATAKHASIAQGSKIVSELIPPPEQPKKKIKINKSTPSEFDKKTNVFIEPTNEYPDELEYERSGSDQGIVIIFNQVKFVLQSNKKRLGSTKDVNDIIFTLGRLGYNIEEKYLFTNSTSKELNTKVDEILQEDLSNRNSLILFYLSHGDEDDAIMTTDGQVNTRHIWEELANHKDLQKKPKFFVFQACKGGSYSARPNTKEEIKVEHKISYISLSNYEELPSDILLCYSSIEGMRSYRDPKKGSWLIQEICKTFLAYGRRDDVFTLLTRVTKCVSSYMYENNKQLPVVVSTLSRKFYLSKSKDRTNNLVVNSLYENINKILAEIDKNTASLDGAPLIRKQN